MKPYLTRIYRSLSPLYFLYRDYNEDLEQESGISELKLHPSRVLPGDLKSSISLYVQRCQNARVRA